MTKRFEQAVMKLYTAFHEGTLNAYKCEACAVGNILGHGNWTRLEHDSPISFIGIALNNSGYSIEELSNIEIIFMDSHHCFFETVRERQFKGLCAVVEYLAELDNIPNPMDYTKLFEQEGGNPKHANLCATE